MKNLLIVALIVSAFACSKKEEVKVDPNAPKTGKFEYTFTAQPEKQDRPTTISFNFYTIQGGKNVNTSKTFVLTQSNNIARWDTTLSANKVTANIKSPSMRSSGVFEARFNGATVYNQEVNWDQMHLGMGTKDL